MKRRDIRESGYTLLELMYVVSIVALLAAMLIPQILTQRTRIVMAKAQQRLKTIGSVMVDYSLSSPRDAYGNFEDLKKANLISTDLTLSNIIVDYSLAFSTMNRTSEMGDPPKYTIIAYPRPERSQGHLSTFAITEDNVVRVYRPGGGHDPEDPYTWDPII
jgi:prepilin-type N-terminal cleavage/methylation domain-containing protein